MDKCFDSIFNITTDTEQNKTENDDVWDTLNDIGIDGVVEELNKEKYEFEDEACFEANEK